MRWRNRSSWWGFHLDLLQPISCRNGPPGRLCFLLPAIQMTHVQSPVSEIDQGEIQTEIFAPKAPLARFLRIVHRFAVLNKTAAAANRPMNKSSPGIHYTRQ